MVVSIEGGCLCGAVHYTANGEPMMAGHCFCSDCRKASGTSHSTHVVFPDAAVAMSGPIKAFERAADSGNMVIRNFCSNCGSAIYSTNSAMPGTIFIRASSLDEPSRVSPMMAVYVSRAPQWATIDPSLPQFAEMPEGGAEAAVAEA